MARLQARAGGKEAGGVEAEGEVSEPIDYETPPAPPRKEPFWPRGLHPLDFAIIFVGLVAFAFLEDRLDAAGWLWWVLVAAASAAVWTAMYVRRVLSPSR